VKAFGTNSQSIQSVDASFLKQINVFSAEVSPILENRRESKQAIMVGGCIDSKEFEDIAEIYDLIRAQNMN
jgi:hypothetical protein